ncbi:MAG: endonuclease/exonuclease/phosphatase family protein, partial [Rhodothermales bacterium]
MRYLVVLFLLLLVPSLAYAQAARILLDGFFDDWETLDPAHADSSGDAPAGAVDFARLWISNDEHYLFLRFELGAETLIQEGNQIILYLDTDDDPATGQPIHGLGADLTWNFGQRTGLFFISNTVGLGIGHSPVGIVTAPTISSTVFEVAFERDALPDGQQALFPGATIRLVLEDTAGGDLLPDAPGGIPYTFDDATTLPALVPATLRKQDPRDLRLLSYNVQLDALFDPTRGLAFARLLQAVAPDIIGFQEILGHTAEQTAAVVAAAVPLPSDQTWQAARVSPDLVVVSRFPIRSSFVIEGVNQGQANAAFLLDLQTEWGTDLLLIDA